MVTASLPQRILRRGCNTRRGGTTVRQQQWNCSFSDGKERGIDSHHHLCTLCFTLYRSTEGLHDDGLELGVRKHLHDPTPNVQLSSAAFYGPHLLYFCKSQRRGCLGTQSEQSAALLCKQGLVVIHYTGVYTGVYTDVYYRI